MLVLKRKTGESVVIGDDIEVTVVSVDKNSVRLAIDAPRLLSIYRREIWDEIKKENLKALHQEPQQEKLKEMNIYFREETE